MVIPGEPQSERYLGASDGAPPLPPAGGYRGAKRDAKPLPDGAPKPQRTVEEERLRKRAWIGMGAFVAAIAFVVILLLVLSSGGAHALYGFNMLAVQIAVLVLVIIALCTPGARKWGSAALAVCLLVNVATVGASGALNSATTGNYENIKTDKQKFWEKYPGVKDQNPDDLLSGATLEELQTSSDDTMTLIKDRLTADFGITWASPVAEMKRPMRNGYGGESWFFTWTSPKEMSEQAIHGTADKQAVVDAINDVLSQTEYGSLYSLSEPGYRDDAVIEQLYGSTDPTKQAKWEFTSSEYTTDLYLYVTFVDLSNDTADGRFRTERESWQKRTGEPLEGVQMFLVSGPTISETQIEPFRELLKDYK